MSSWCGSCGRYHDSLTSACPPVGPNAPLGPPPQVFVCSNCSSERAGREKAEASLASATRRVEESEQIIAGLKDEKGHLESKLYSAEGRLIELSAAAKEADAAMATWFSAEYNGHPVHLKLRAALSRLDASRSREGGPDAR